MYMSSVDEPVSSGDELRVFWLLLAVAAPLLTVAVVGGYGFVVWIFQMFAGPPGPPAG